MINRNQLFVIIRLVYYLHVQVELPGDSKSKQRFSLTSLPLRTVRHNAHVLDDKVNNSIVMSSEEA